MREAWVALAVAATVLVGAGAAPLGAGDREKSRRTPSPPPPPHRATELAPPGDSWPEEGGLFEGDIILHPGEAEWLRRRALGGAGGGAEGRAGRNLVASRRQLWPGGVVFYDWGAEFSNATQRRIIEAALADIEARSCVRFRRRTTQKTYLLLRNTRSGCAAPVGYVPIGRPIDLFLGQPGCQRRGTVQHEFLHTLGFWHEHTRPDRDDHVAVKWSNIRPGLEFNFFVRPAKEVQYLKMPYDYDSVMHYRSLAFSKDGHSHTIMPRDPRALTRMGQRERFSKIDLAKINRLYNCPPPYYRGFDVVQKKSPALVVNRVETEDEDAEWPGAFPLTTPGTEPSPSAQTESSQATLPSIPPPPPLPELPTLPTEEPAPAPPSGLPQPTAEVGLPAPPAPFLLPAPPVLPVSQAPKPAVTTAFISPPPPPPLLPLPIMPPQQRSTTATSPTEPSPPSSPPGSGVTDGIVLPAPAPEGPVYVIEERTAENGRALPGCKRSLPEDAPGTATEKTPTSHRASSAVAESRRTKGNTEDAHTPPSNGPAPTIETTSDAAAGLVWLFLHLAGIA